MEYKNIDLEKWRTIEKETNKPHTNTAIERKQEKHYLICFNYLMERH